MSRQFAYGEEEIPPRLQQGTDAREKREREKRTIPDSSILLRRYYGGYSQLRDMASHLLLDPASTEWHPCKVLRRRQHEPFDIYDSDASIIWRMR
jgi:hypothetical protein